MDTIEQTPQQDPKLVHDFVAKQMNDDDHCAVPGCGQFATDARHWLMWSFPRPLIPA